MADNFSYDVFLSHSSKDKTVVRAVAERLKTDGLEVWFDEWSIKVGDNIPHKIEEGLEHSRVLVLCMSANAFGSDWAQLEAGTFRFRDPLNKERRFIPLRLDDAPIKGSLNQFLYIDWLPDDRDQAFAKLLEACRPPAKRAAEADGVAARTKVAEKVNRLNSNSEIRAYAFTSDGKRALTGSGDNTVRLWDVKAGSCLRVFEGHTNQVWSVAWSPDQHLALSGSDDNSLRLWDIDTGSCLRVFEDHTNGVNCVAWSADQHYAISGGDDKTLRLWDVERGRCLRVFEGHTHKLWSVAWSNDQRHVLSGSSDCTARLWEVATGRSLRIFEGHTSVIRELACSIDRRFILSGSWDRTVRLWDVETGHCLRVLEGHTSFINSVALSADGLYALSGADDRTVRLWDVGAGRCLRVLEGHTSNIRSVAWGTDQRRAFSGDVSGGIRVWELSEFVTEPRGPKVTTPALPSAPDQVQYTNAKVLLVGESGAGKTGLSKVLAGEKWQPSDSTVGAWATQWKLPVASAEDGGDGVEREIWLWDFGGQADQRLIHQLYMDETALAVLVFDGQKEDLFETLGQWDRDLTRASQKDFAKLLVAGRVDAGGLRVSRSQVEAFAKERGYTGFLETSAKANLRCEELKQAILDGIPWENIPWRSSPLLFKRLKEEIVRLKDAGRVLMRFNELRETLQLRLSGEMTRFTDEELKAVVSLLAGPGVVWELKFGSWVLLQPERINAYAQAVIQTMREDEHERGCLPEERVLNGDLTYHSSIERLGSDEERFILLAMHQTLVERGLCLREHGDTGTLLVFPSYYRRERPELVGHPAVLVSYRFNGFLDDIYATLVVRLHHTEAFESDELWRYAADFKTLTGKQLGVKMIRRGEGAGELEVYFDPVTDVGEKIIFSKYVHEHLLQNARDVVRLRYYVCPHCGTQVGNREVAMKRLNAWLETGAAQSTKSSLFKGKRGKPDRPTILCSECEKRVPLWDDLEEHFASPETKQRVHELQEQSAIVLDNESKERALVGEVISTVALAGQLSREFNVSDHGIDMEIEFKSDAGEATGRKVYLQLKSGDSYLRERKRDDAEVFTIKDERHARYWMAQEFPVLLVIRNSDGETRWMEVRDWLKLESDDGKKLVKQIVFAGERLDVMSVRGWRERALSQGPPSPV
jgi:small GTP-binding protein